jgi:hypothetical protein
MIKRECLILFEEEFEDTKWVIRIRKSKTNRKHNGQKKKNKRLNNDLQNITHKTKIQVTSTPLKTGCAPEATFQHHLSMRYIYISVGTVLYIELLILIKISLVEGYS